MRIIELVIRVLVIGNRLDDDAGYIGERLSQHGAELSVVHREQLEHTENDADMVLLLGSDWSVYENGNAASVALESKLARRAIEKHQPLLAVCYGAQLVAHSLGMTVRRSDQPEIGWVYIDSTNDALCPSGPWFQLHFDHWIESDIVTTIGRNGVGPQAFVIGRTLAVQFHPEVTPVTAARWLDDLPGQVVADRRSIDADTRKYASAARSACHQLVDQFLTTVAGFDVATARR